MNPPNSQGESIESLYRNLTGIKIDDQLKLWDARGKGYYGEYLLFSELYGNIPGQCKILMNLQIPSEYGRTTEIDLLLIHETGIYVFEAKHYKGTIYGKVNEPQWTQYFRTASNQRLNNPIAQNGWHVEQLRKIYHSLPIHSFVVFTNKECTLKIEGHVANTTLCYQRHMRRCFTNVCQRANICLTTDEIDEIFNTLKVYSPIREVAVTYNGNDLNLYQFIEKIDAHHCAKMQYLDHSYDEKEKSLQKNYAERERGVQHKLRMIKAIAVAVCVAILFLSVLIGSLVTSSYLSEARADIAQANAEMEKSKMDAEKAKEELKNFAKKWEIVTEFEINGESIKEDFVLVKDVVLENSVDIDDMVKFSCVLTHNGEEFYVLIDKSSMFTVVLVDGRVIEHPYYSSPYYSYSLGYSSSYEKLEIKDVEFTGFSFEDVRLIKLTNLQIKRIKHIYYEGALLDDYEIVLYKAE